MADLQKLLREVAGAWVLVSSPEHHKVGCGIALSPRGDAFFEPCSCGVHDRIEDARKLLNSVAVAQLGHCVGKYVFECAAGHQKTISSYDPVCPPSSPACREESCAAANNYFPVRMHLVRAPERSK